MKTHLHIRIASSLDASVTEAASQPGLTKSLVIEKALARLFDPGGDARAQDALQRRLDGHTKTLDRLARDLNILAESFSLYVRMYLMVTPPMPASALPAARALAGKRFESYVSQLGQRLSAGHSLSEHVLSVMDNDDAGAISGTARRSVDDDLSGAANDEDIADAKSRGRRHG